MSRCRSTVCGTRFAAAPVAAVLAVTVLVGTSCTSQPGGTARRPGAETRSRKPDFSVEPPPSLDGGLVALRRDEALRRALLPLDRIVKQLPRPKFLSDSDDVDETAAPEPQLIAQRQYLAARLAWRRGMRYEARKQLHDAHRVAPRHAAILRLLGRIYDEQRNSEQSYRIFEQAVRLEPDDPYTLIMLARHCMDQGRWDDAIVTLAHLQSLAGRLDARIGFLPIVHFYLGNALRRQGYDAAAAEQWLAYMALEVRYDRLSDNLREEAILLHRGRAVIWRKLGDAYHRVGRPQLALEAYRRADAGSVNVDAGLVNRLTFTFLRLRLQDQAQQTVVDQLSQGQLKPEAPALIDYLVKSGVDPSGLASKLRHLYLQQQRETLLLLAMVRLVAPSKRDVLMKDHMAAKPSDRVVYEQLMGRLLEDGDVAAATEALRITASAVEAIPKAAEVYASILVRRAASSSLREALDALEPAVLARPTMQYLRGRILEAAGEIDESHEAYRAAVAADPALQVAKLALLRSLVEHGRYAEAQEAIGLLSGRQSAQIVALRARVLAEQNKPNEALRLLNQALIRNPTDQALVMQKAELQRLAGDSLSAEDTLLDLLNARPRSHRVYEMLIDMYLLDSPGIRWERGYADLVKGMRRHIPSSRIARREKVRRAIASANQGRTDSDIERAEKQLRTLHTEDPQDHRTLGLLIGFLIEADRPGEAESLLEERLAENPERRAVQVLTQRFYHTMALRHLQKKEFDEVVEVVDRALSKPIHDPSVLLIIQRRALMVTDQCDQIEPKLREAISRFAHLEAELLLSWAMALELQGEAQRAEAVMFEILGKHPDHAATNNSLGYSLADRDERLNDAERMIRIAVEAEPDNAAYLDSLGWVYYKRGRFREAVEQLSKATMQPNGADPVILDHMGDALFRMERAAEALMYWNDALESVTPDNRDRGLDMKRLVPRVEAKINALKVKERVPVAGSPGAEAEDPGTGPDDRQGQDGDAGAAAADAPNVKSSK